MKDTYQELYAGMRDELNEALSKLDRVALMYPCGTDVRRPVDRARSQVASALLFVLKREAANLREHLDLDEAGELPQ